MAGRLGLAQYLRPLLGGLGSAEFSVEVDRCQGMGSKASLISERAMDCASAGSPMFRAAPSVRATEYIHSGKYAHVRLSNVSVV